MSNCSAWTKASAAGMVFFTPNFTCVAAASLALSFSPARTSISMYRAFTYGSEANLSTTGCRKATASA